MDFPAFAQHVREALARLYDRPYLQTHPLAALLSSTSEELSGDALHRLLLDAIEQLRPPEPTPLTAPARRHYECLSLRYVQGATPEAVARQLGVSPRQARRDHLEALEAVASVLWNRYRRLDRAREHARDLAGDRNGTAHDAGPPSLEAELTKLGAGRRGQTVGLDEAVDDALAIVGGLATAKRVRLGKALPPALPPLVFDRMILRQALLSLLSYAFELGRGGQIDLVAAQSRGAVELAIRIQPGSMGCVDRSSEQADALLAAGRRMLEAQGGVLQMQGDPARLRQLTLTLPTRPGLTVLVIDDNPDVARLFRRFLRGREYLLTHASTGQKALQLAREAHPDVITLDLLMPTQDGWDILRQLKAHRDTRAIPVVVCSILPDRELAISAGAASFLPKPITQASLIAILESVTISSRSAESRG